jgi:aminoglycoside/choline kinase family phosphotransferase
MNAHESEKRLLLLDGFLKANNLSGANVSPLADDCSFRRYFRVSEHDSSFIVMDAPPDQEEITPFMKISKLLNEFGYSAPKVLAADTKNGFLILEDFGNTTYTKALLANENEYYLYCLAIDLLIDIRNRRDANAIEFLPVYTVSKLLEEVLLFVDWYLIQRLEINISGRERETFISAWSSCLQGLADGSRNILVLRDYHVDNLMLLSDRNGLNACGLLDFQDAVSGHASYDLVSLLQDSRRDISPSLRDRMLDRYFNGIGKAVNKDAFMKSYYILGAQRALKVFGIFARQSLKYGNDQYLVHIPRLWQHSMKNLSSPQMKPVQDWLMNSVSEKVIKVEITSFDRD